MSSTKVIITVVLSAECEVEFRGEEQLLLAKAIAMHPLVHIMDEAKPLNEEDRSRVKIMCLHTVVTKCAARLSGVDKELKSSTEINMNPPSGERS